MVSLLRLLGSDRPQPRVEPGPDGEVRPGEGEDQSEAGEGQAEAGLHPPHILTTDN